MKRARHSPLLAVLAVLALTAIPSTAQQGGFRAGIAHQTAFPPTQAPAVAVRPTFIGVPNFVAAPISPFIVAPQQFIIPGQQFIVPGQPFAHPQQFGYPGQPIIVPGQVFVPNQVFIPNQVFVPNQLVAPTQPAIVTPHPVFVPNHILLPGQTYVPPPPVITAAPTAVFQPVVPRTHYAVPAIGTSRAHVIQQMGHPLVTVITSRGEVLQFTGGVTVVIQNDQVIRAK
jgi:hypothetical protein